MRAWERSSKTESLAIKAASGDLKFWRAQGDRTTDPARAENKRASQLGSLSHHHCHAAHITAQEQRVGSQESGWKQVEAFGVRNEERGQGERMSDRGSILFNSICSEQLWSGTLVALAHMTAPSRKTMPPPKAPPFCLAQTSSLPPSYFLALREEASETCAGAQLQYALAYV
ncbi:hypothetical protein BDV95DRAFT_357701 [Massariosphaeria phaeospora]|uniref:Uncharacterized protein n=1 Tax=Massariosphaeria phaeospora TaxID=100035 RepID=A0A7C8MAD4_9PLEO|nr:hypothetical protein BDV95DRAFT_357701 [Massariosphaeria phaeospora]